MTEIIQIDENTWSIEDMYVRFFLIAGDDRAVLLDSGINTPNAKEIAEKLTDKPIMLVNTHGDMDHASGTGAFDEIHMAKEDYYNCGLAERFPDTKLVELKDGDTIDLGGRTLEAITVPGHTKGSVAILDTEKRVLYAGDTVQSGHIFMFGPHRAPDMFADALGKLIGEADRYDKIIASHDNPELDGDYASKVLESWNEVWAGKYEGSDIMLHGMMVKSYDAKYCGFYCES